MITEKEIIDAGFSITYRTITQKYEYHDGTTEILCKSRKPTSIFGYGKRYALLTCLNPIACGNEYIIDAVADSVRINKKSKFFNSINELTVIS